MEQDTDIGIQVYFADDSSKTFRCASAKVAEGILALYDKNGNVKYGIPLANMRYWVVL